MRRSPPRSTRGAPAVQESRGFDVAILDARGLGPEGLEFAAELRAARPDRPTEIVFLSSIDSLLADERLQQIDAFASLAKPVRPSELYDALASIAAGRRSGRGRRWLARRSTPNRQLQFDARILVAEDNDVNQDVAMAMLDNLGCRVVTAPNGRAAVRAFAQDRFDLILMDCEMPELDGFEATRRIREIEGMSSGLSDDGRAAKAPVPIIAVTAHALPEMRQKCLDAGMSDFLVKPFDELQLSEALRRWLPVAEEGRVRAGDMGDDAPSDGDTGLPDDPIDLAAVDQIRQMERRGRVGLFRGIVEKFAASAPTMAAEVRAKCVARDAEALWRAAHALKSSASALGGRALAARCSEIEAAARATGAASVDALLDGLDEDVAEAIERLQVLSMEADAPAA